LESREKNFNCDRRIPEESESVKHASVAALPDGLGMTDYRDPPDSLRSPVPLERGTEGMLVRSP